MPKGQEDVFMDLDLDKNYVPPEDNAEAADVPEIPETPETPEEVIETSPDDEVVTELLDQPEDDGPLDEPEDDSNLDDLSVEELLKEIEEADDDVDEAKDDLEKIVDESWDKDLKTKYEELLTKIDEKERLLNMKDNSLNTLEWEHSRLAKDNNMSSVRINELESLVAPIEDNNDLKALVAYTTKGDEGKGQRVELLKRMLAADWYDIDAIEWERTRQEKTSLWWDASWSAPVNFELDKEKGEVFSDL